METLVWMGLLRSGSSCGVGGVHPLQVAGGRPEISWLALYA